MKLAWGKFTFMALSRHQYPERLHLFNLYNWAAEGQGACSRVVGFERIAQVNISIAESLSKESYLELYSSSQLDFISCIQCHQDFNCAGMNMNPICCRNPREQLSYGTGSNSIEKTLKIFKYEFDVLLTHASLWTPFEKLCLQCLQTDSTWA